MLLETNVSQIGENEIANTYTSGQLMKLTEMMEKKGMTSERFGRILASGLLTDIFDPGARLDNRKGVRDALKLPPLLRGDQPVTPERTVILVDYGLTLEQMIAAGKYDWKNDDINPSQFPVRGEGQVEYEARLFHFNISTSSPDAERGIKDADTARPWAPGQIEHLLAFGAKHPEEQHKHPIVALGSVGNATFFGKHNVPYLYRRVAGRSLHLDWLSNEWSPAYHFLAVRERLPGAGHQNPAD